MTDDERANVFESLLRSQGWRELEVLMRHDLAVIENEAMAMGTEDKRRNELAGQRTGIMDVLGRPDRFITDTREG